MAIIISCDSGGVVEAKQQLAGTRLIGHDRSKCMNMRGTINHLPRRTRVAQYSAGARPAPSRQADRCIYASNFKRRSVPSSALSVSKIAREHWHARCHIIQRLLSLTVLSLSICQSDIVTQINGMILTQILRNKIVDD